MILFVLLGRAPLLLVLAQLGMLYLVVLDMREEEDLDFQRKVWWCLAVLLFGVVGFAGEKLWLAGRRRRGRATGDDRRPG